MSKIRTAIVGYGNIGHYILQAVQAASDMELAGIVRRKASREGCPELEGINVVTDIKELGTVDVAILATPSRSIPEYAAKCLSLGISTVDSFDIHTDIFALRENLDKLAKEHGCASIVSAGWDPGTDSIVRALLLAMAPKGVTWTNFGPGMSMGHTVAVKAIDGVKDALSMTIPVGTGIHRRLVYVQKEENADFKLIEKAIKEDPYFVHDETHVFEVSNVDAMKDMGHGVDLYRKGVSGSTHDQVFDFKMSINNPALTGQILVSAARAVTKCRPGAYTMIEIPLIDFLEGEKESLIRSLV